MQPLARLRLQLTAWYAGVFSLVLALLGAGLFLTIRHQMSRHVDKSLSAAAAALEQAARIRETERASARGAVVDAVDELHIPDRSLYLLDEKERPIKPAEAPGWVLEATHQAVRSKHGYRNLDAPDGRELRIYAGRFTGTTGIPYIAAVVADRLELEDEYTSLIETFAAAALAALLLVAGGGYLLIRKSTAPVERSMDQMRRFMADAAHGLRTPRRVGGDRPGRRARFGHGGRHPGRAALPCVRALLPRRPSPSHRGRRRARFRHRPLDRRRARRAHRHPLRSRDGHSGHHHVPVVAGLEADPSKSRSFAPAALRMTGALAP